MFTIKPMTSTDLADYDPEAAVETARRAQEAWPEDEEDRQTTGEASRQIRQAKIAVGLFAAIVLGFVAWGLTAVARNWGWFR